MSDFLWCKFNDNLVVWNRVCRSNEERGLGLGNWCRRSKNIALVGKMATFRIKFPSDTFLFGASTVFTRVGRLLMVREVSSLPVIGSSSHRFIFLSFL